MSIPILIVSSTFLMNGYKTYIGILVAAVPTIAHLFGYEVTESFAGQFTSLADLLVQIVGLCFAAYGRAVAESPGWLVKK